MQQQPKEVKQATTEKSSVGTRTNNKQKTAQLRPTIVICQWHWVKVEDKIWKVL